MELLKTVEIELSFNNKDEIFSFEKDLLEYGFVFNKIFESPDLEYIYSGYSMYVWDNYDNFFTTLHFLIDKYKVNLPRFIEGGLDGK